MLGMSKNVVSQDFLINPSFSLVKDFEVQARAKFKYKRRDYQIDRVLNSGSTQYLTWFAYVVLIATKYEKYRICVDCRDLKKTRPKDNFPLPYIPILIDNYAKNELQSFMDFYVGYHFMLMDVEDAQKKTFNMPWGVRHYRVMLFDLKSIGSTYMRAMTTSFMTWFTKRLRYMLMMS